MTTGGKFVSKILLAILATAIAAFLALAGNYFYKIKTGGVMSLQFTKSGAPMTEPGNLDSKKIISDKSPYFGAPNPELTVVVFGNFYCPNSQKVSETMREMMLKYRDKTKFIYREYPMDDVYQNSSYLALAGKCANEQNKFWPFYDKIYRNPSIDLATVDPQIGLESVKFLECLKQSKYYAAIKNDLVDGFNSGVRGTPTFFFIKKSYENQPLKIEGAIPRDTLEKIIEKLLK